MNSSKRSESSDPEYGLDSRYSSKKEQESEAILLMEERLNRMKNLSKEDIIRAKLTQLKLKMEEYLEPSSDHAANRFTHFLRSYIDTIYSKRSKFADDLNISPINLSQIINNHREPHDEFMLKLMIHSEKVYKNVGNFPKEMWYQLYFHEKIMNTMSNQEKWRPKLEKKVTLSEEI